MVSTSVDIPDDATYDEALAVVEERLSNGARVTGEWIGLKKVARLRDEDRDRDNEVRDVVNIVECYLCVPLTLVSVELYLVHT